MWTFDASLRTLGDRKGLAATLTIEDGRLAIDAGDQPIGEWSLSEIRLEPTPTGYRMAAEGEQILLDIENVDDFTLALNGKKVKGRKKDAPSPEASTKVKRDRKAAEPEPAPARTERAEKPEKTKESKHAEERGFGEMVAAFLDTTLDQASEKWGHLFPAWVFTRGTVYTLAALFAVVIIFPTVFFWLLLVTGVLMVMFGAVVYTDSVAAARWLPGKFTPMHVLIYGVGLVVFAVFVGVASHNRILIVLLGLGLAAGVTFAARFRKTAA